MTAQESLLPCPFCGCAPKLEGTGSIRWITCPKESECGSSGMAMGIAADDLDRGIAAWNRRQPVARTPLSANEVSALLEQAGYWTGDLSCADFINGLRHGEQAHGIVGITQEKQG